MISRLDPLALIQTIVDAGHRAPSADNSQPWRFCWDGKYLSVIYDNERVFGKTFGPEEHATLLAMGAVKENILQMAKFLEVDVEQVQIDNASGYFRFKFKLSTKEITEAHEHPLFQRHTNRWPFDSRPIPSQIIDSLSGMSHGQCRALIFAERDMIKRIARWVRVASEVRFQSRDVHELLGVGLRFTADEASQGDGLDVRTLPLPPGGKTFLRFIKDWDRLAFLNRFGCYKILALVEAKPVSDATYLVAIAGPDGCDNALDAGMLMERTWIRLNSQGIAVHPYYVITDQLQRLKTRKIAANLSTPIKAFETEIATLLNYGTIHMLFRIGYPKKQPRRSSLRLPSEKITEFIHNSELEVC
ncbi:MAG TPA: hypothetical protein VGK77_04725 [Candidatus Binatia bacterium]|jgi:hypothetical protein